MGTYRTRWSHTTQTQTQTQTDRQADTHTHTHTPSAHVLCLLDTLTSQHGVDPIIQVFIGNPMSSLTATVCKTRPPEARSNVCQAKTTPTPDAFLVSTAAEALPTAWRERWEAAYVRYYTLVIYYICFPQKYYECESKCR